MRVHLSAILPGGHAHPIMQQQQLLAFLVFSVVAAVTPGPSNLLLLACGAQAGFRRGLPCLAGVVAGMALLMAAAGAGLGSLVAAWPAAVMLLTWGGAAWLLWLAWQIAAAPAQAAGSAAPRSAAPVGFWRALAFQWVNPKSWIVSVSAAATFAAGGAAAPAQRALLLAATFALAATPACALWLAGGAALQRWLVDERAARVFNVAMGLLLAASVVLGVL
jgi:threonine/homoserine/homoserine lactone efflux protein